MSEITLQRLLEDLLKSGKESDVKLIEFQKKTYRVRTVKIGKKFITETEPL